MILPFYFNFFYSVNKKGIQILIFLNEINFLFFFFLPVQIKSDSLILFFLLIGWYEQRNKNKNIVLNDLFCKKSILY